MSGEIAILIWGRCLPTASPRFAIDLRQIVSTPHRIPGIYAKYIAKKYSSLHISLFTTATAPILSFVPVTDPIAKSIASDYTVYARQPVVALVHKDSDLPASAEAKSTGGASVSLSSSGGSASPSKKSVARRVLPRLTGVVSVSLVAALVGIPWM